MTNTHEVTSPECWMIVHRASGQLLVDVWFNHKRGQWCCDFDNKPDEAMRFPTREAAVASFKAYHMNPKTAGLKRILATVKLTEAGKADVLARRAARNAERKLV